MRLIKTPQAVFSIGHVEFTLFADRSERDRILALMDDIGEIDGGEDYDIVIKKHREKRSLNANSYYWVLVHKLSAKLGISSSELHNELLSRYGELQKDADGNVVYIMLKDTEDYMKDSNIHLKATSKTKRGNDGKIYRWFVLMKGSSAYDTKEMSRLLDGLISECKEQSIETMTPRELAGLKGYEVTGDFSEAL